MIGDWSICGTYLKNYMRPQTLKEERRKRGKKMVSN